MKLYLSSFRIPTPNDLETLLGKPLSSTSVALIANAKDYYAERPRNLKVGDLVTYMRQLGLSVELVDLRDYDDADVLRQKLAAHDLIWAMGGNTFMLRHQMRRSGFQSIIRQLLEDGIVYGGDSAGALVAGISIAGVELADDPQFAEEVIEEGLNLVPFFVLPHVGNPEFTDAASTFRELHQDGNDIIELTDSQAAIFDGDSHRVVTASE